MIRGVAFGSTFYVGRGWRLTIALIALRVLH